MRFSVSGFHLLLVLSLTFMGCGGEGPTSVGPVTEHPSPALVDAMVAIANPDGSGIRRVAWGESPSWSPDELRLVFARDGFIHTVNIDGAGLTRLGAGHSPSWSPKGDKVAFVSGAGLSVMTTGGTGIVTLIGHRFREGTYDFNQGIQNPEWSPDGTRILFEHGGSTDFDTGAQQPRIYVMNADGSNMHPVSTEDPQYSERDAAWSPDGREVFFMGHPLGLSRVPASGGTPVALGGFDHPHVAWVGEPHWSSSGQMAFHTSSGRSAYGYALWTAPASGGLPTLRIPGGYSAKWSPSGRRLALVLPGAG